MSIKNLIFVVSTNGTGNHLLAELLGSFGLKRINDNPAVFWLLYLKTLADPQGLCSCPKISASQGRMTNEEALKKLYNSWGYQLKPSEMLSESIAKATFKEIICEKIRERDLVLMHAFEYIHALTVHDKQGNIYSWSQGESDNAFRLLIESLDDQSINIKYLCLIRHPLSIYLSMRERFGEHMEHGERIKRIVGFFRRIENIKSEGVDFLLIRYEDLCENTNYVLRGLVNWIFNNSENCQYAVQDALLIPQKASKKNPSPKIEDDTDLLKEIASRHGYPWKDNTSFLNIMNMQIETYIYDLGIITKALLGKLDSTTIITRHKFSIPARLLIWLVRHMPFFYSKLELLRKKHKQMGINGRTVQPEDFTL